MHQLRMASSQIPCSPNKLQLKLPGSDLSSALQFHFLFQHGALWNPPRREGSPGGFHRESPVQKVETLGASVWCGRCWDIRISYNPDTGNKESLKKCFKLKEKTANTLPFFVRCCLVTCLCVKFYPIFTSSRFIRVCPTGYPKTI